MVYSQQHRSISILMLPWLTHGHISPFLELAKKLTHKRNNLHFYICSTPVNLTSIKSKLSGKYSHCIEFVELHLPHDELPELPPHYHTTNGLPPHLMSTLKKAFNMSSSNFSDILQTLKPDLLIYDFLQPWAPSLALSHNIPAVEFSTINAATIISIFANHFKNSSLEFPFPGIHLRDYEIRMFKNQVEFSSSGLKDGERIQQCSSSSCNIILVKTSREIEAKYIDLQDPLDQKTDEESPIIQWLNKREKSSVVYVSFGSEFFLSKKEIEEIAHRLELSKVSFIWVIRFPKEDKTTKVEEVLPKGFVERVGERGMIVEGWAPQAKILQHPGVGGSVSHCGWSSVLESIKFGVPIIAMPMQLDQPVNAKLVEEVGVGVEAKRAEGGGLQGEAIAEAIGDMVVKKIGEDVRMKALEVRDNVKKIEDEEINDVLEKLVRLCA
ncbi:flavanone 7-O-glucoside 2''-O-beta-L-rhamnosyltransferase-like [Pyrus ussuriensis x Pyrus communis]|uniref:Flavanone 7-O-glucoside 2''-O-beta-L-rhamnosyltransferase-like n=1 Tax=Pyrus ussuriensis x Pyrus communis TaxID=2448454 RepID=A0A5N5H3K0_9ROSA|nr:flavanone 7-O-glucoside 2''-O-beta-L-rhamnosyltransferase-like [Pyrus ussuriensis x Pyrus communis]